MPRFGAKAALPPFDDKATPPRSGVKAALPRFGGKAAGEQPRPAPSARARAGPVSRSDTVRPVSEIMVEEVGFEPT